MKLNIAFNLLFWRRKTKQIDFLNLSCGSFYSSQINFNVHKILLMGVCGKNTCWFWRQTKVGCHSHWGAFPPCRQGVAVLPRNAMCEQIDATKSQFENIDHFYSYQGENGGGGEWPEWPPPRFCTIHDRHIAHEDLSMTSCTVYDVILHFNLI